MTIEPAAEFRALPEDAVMAALADPDPNNPIACEVARLIGCYTQNFKAIEAVAMRLVTEAIRQEIAKH